MSHEYVPRMINLESQDYQVVRRVADQRGLGEKGFSAALRMIIREWQEFQLQDPGRMTAENADRPWSYSTSGAAPDFRDNPVFS